MFKLKFPLRVGRGCRFFERCSYIGGKAERGQTFRHSDGLSAVHRLCRFFSLCKNITPYLQFNEVNWVRVTKPPSLPSSLSLSLPLLSQCVHTLLGAPRTNNLKRESRCCINRIRTFLLSFLVSRCLFPPQIKWCDGWSQNMLRPSFARYVLVHFSNWKWLEMKNGSETIWFQTSKG